MLSKSLLGIACLTASMHAAIAQVDVNKADRAALDSVAGLGPAATRTILDERTKNGAFKDWTDFQSRVKGIGDKSAARLSDAGLTVDGQSRLKASAENTHKPGKAGKSKAGSMPVASTVPLNSPALPVPPASTLEGRSASAEAEAKR